MNQLPNLTTHFQLATTTPPDFQLWEISSNSYLSLIKYLFAPFRFAPVGSMLHSTSQHHPQHLASCMHPPFVCVCVFSSYYSSFSLFCRTETSPNYKVMFNTRESMGEPKKDIHPISLFRTKLTLFV